MALRTDYWPGGFLPAAPAKNRKLEVDSVANTVTLWDRQGNQTSQRALTAAEQTEAAAADAATLRVTQGQAAEVNVRQAYTTLRQWAQDARGTTVTQGNAVATLQVVVTRLGVFFDRFADLLQSQDLDGS